MNAFIIGLYGVYLFMVGLSGNQTALSNGIKSDAPGFLPWAISIAVLAMANDFPATQKIVGPFLFLLILTFILRNFDTLREQYRGLYDMAAGHSTYTSEVANMTGQGHG